MGEQKTHNLALDGVSGFVLDVKNGGQEITISGWNYDHRKWRAGDLIILTLEDNGGRTTRYKIKDVRPCGNPSDMYFADLEFYPR